MYVARRELKTVSKDNKTTIFRPGDEVKDFEKWDQVAARAHLNLGWVEKIAGKPTKAKRLDSDIDVVEPPIGEKPAMGKVVACPVCMRGFSSQKAMTSHRGRTHGKNVNP